MQERLQKILSQAGIASRREAEKIITDGRVAVNGTVVTELGTKADPDMDVITVDGKALTIEENRVYILLYKPVGYMTTMKDPEGRPIVTDLLKGVKERVYPIGRLDYNTEGLLLLTNDGALANSLMHPSHEVDKGYLVRVSGHVSPEQIAKLAEGVRLEDGMTAPAKVLPVSESEHNSWISITIHEGRYRQVRRMCEAVGLNVVRLKRSRYDFLEIGNMKPGEFRLLRPEEVARLGRKTPSAAGHPLRTSGAVAKPSAEAARRPGEAAKRPGEAARRSGEAAKPFREAAKRPGEWAKRAGEDANRVGQFSKRPAEGTRPAEGKHPAEAAKRRGEAEGSKHPPVKRR